MRKAVTKALLAFSLLTATLPALSACNTFAGMGQDLQRGGAAIEREAQRGTNR